MQKLHQWIHFSKMSRILLLFAGVAPLLLVRMGDAVFPNILYFLMLAPLIFVVTLVTAFVKRRVPIFVTAFLYLVITAACFQGRLFLRYHERWLTNREPYRSQVLTEPREQNNLQHVIWDESGGFGAPPTLTYLVYDPDGELAHKHLRDGGAVPGVPCDVWLIHRLGSNWYSLTFYTGSFWEACNY